MSPMRTAAQLAAAFMVLPVAAAVAGDFDGGQPVICATIDARLCEAETHCLATLPAALDAPQFMRIDFAGKSIVDRRPSGASRTTAVDAVRTIGDRTILNGLEDGAEGTIAWNLVIGQADGRVTLAVAGDGVAFVVFGACTPVAMTPVAAAGAEERKQ
jgi:hypothetical protein